MLILTPRLLSSLPLSPAVLYASFGVMTVGTDGLACAFNWQCTANDIGYAVSWSQYAGTPYRHSLLTSTVWVHPGGEAARAGSLEEARNSQDEISHVSP